MCRLLGLVANQPVDLVFSLERFQNFGRDHPHGWGIGWYSNNQPLLFKKPESASMSEHYEKLSKEVISNLIIAHVRKATVGNHSQENTHPFVWNNWIFAHNGTLSRDLVTLLNASFRNRLKGQTDSEVYFQFLLQNIEENDNIIEGIKAGVHRAQTYLKTAMNFLMSDGKRLYAFRHAIRNKHVYSLYLLKRDSKPETIVNYRSRKTHARVKPHTSVEEKAMILCSEKLTHNESWEELADGNLITIGTDLSITSERILPQA